MTLELLNDNLAALWSQERALIDELLSVLEGFELGEESRRQLQEAVGQVNELFLLVFVGEFNSGKSALINAMLGDSYLREGVTPTTDRIHILKVRGGRAARIRWGACPPALLPKRDSA